MSQPYPQRAQTWAPDHRSRGEEETGSRPKAVEGQGTGRHARDARASLTRRCHRRLAQVAGLPRGRGPRTGQPLGAARSLGWMGAEGSSAAPADGGGTGAEGRLVRQAEPVPPPRGLVGRQPRGAALPQRAREKLSRRGTRPRGHPSAQAGACRSGDGTATAPRCRRARQERAPRRNPRLRAPRGRPATGRDRRQRMRISPR